MSHLRKGGSAANLMFLATAMIWGFAFVAQRHGADHLTPFAFNGVRYILGGICMLPVIFIFEKKGTPWRDKKLLLASLVTGFVLFAFCSARKPTRISGSAPCLPRSVCI